MDLRAILLVLWRRKWILITVPFLAACAAFLIRFFGEWKFVSTAQLTTGLTVSDELIAKDRYLNPYEVQVAFNNLTEMLKSKLVIGQVSYRLIRHDLMDPKSAYRQFEKKKLKKKADTNFEAYFPEFRRILDNKVDSLTLLNPGRPQEKLLQTYIDGFEYDYESLAENLAVYRLNQTDFIELSFGSENPLLSVFVVNTVCSEFIRYYTSTKVSSSALSLESLESIARERKQNLQDKLEELKNFRSRNDIYNSEAESEAKINQIKNYEDQIADEQQNIRGLELTIANLNSRINDAEINLGLHPNDEIINLRRRINSINERYIQGGQSNNNLLDSLNLLRSRLDVAMQKINAVSKISPAELNVMRNKRDENLTELEIARANLSSLNKITNSMHFSIGSLANAEALGKALEKEVSVAEEESQGAQNRLNDAKAKLVTNRISISQVLMAEPAEKAESRKTLIFMMFGGALSFVICSFVIVIIELTDSRIRTAQRFRLKTRLNLAGTISRVPMVDSNLNIIFHSNGKQWAAHEELRKIRFEIISRGCRVLLVTSLEKAQGKSFFVVALAQSLSLLKKRILIIDTNLRNNSLTGLLLARPNFKLLLDNFAKGAKLLESHAGAESKDKEKTSQESELITGTPNALIDIIGNKKSQLSPSEVIPGGDFTVFLEWLKVKYDYIILEGPGLNSYADTKELVKFADLVVPVFSAESTIESRDVDGLNYLKSLQGKLGPAVLNKVES